MTKYLARCAGMATLGLAAVALAAPPASAQTGAFQATPISGPPGTVISVSSVAPCVPSTGTTFARINLTHGSTVIASGQFSASSTGAWSGTLTVGAKATPGAATLGGDCIANPQAEGSLLHYQDVPFTVTSSSFSGATTTPTGKPWAGSLRYEVGIAALAVVLVGLGVVQRRRIKSVRTQA